MNDDKDKVLDKSLLGFVVDTNIKMKILNKKYKIQNILQLYYLNSIQN